MPAVDQLELLRTHVETGFVLTSQGRFAHEAAPDQSRGPRFRIGGCPEGNVALVRDDVSDEIAAELLRLARDEPPLCDAEALPVHLTAYLSLLSVGSAQAVYNLGLNWVFPTARVVDSPLPLIQSGTPEAELLLERIPEAMDPSLTDVGFRCRDDLWPPWVIALDAGRIVSIAETVRRGPAGAEVGVDTAVGHRGRGIGAAVTAAWANHVGLRSLALFYGTSRTNMSSRRLVERLRLTFLGSSLGIT